MAAGVVAAVSLCQGWHLCVSDFSFMVARWWQWLQIHCHARRDAGGSLSEPKRYSLPSHWPEPPLAAREVGRERTNALTFPVSTGLESQGGVSREPVVFTSRVINC